MNAPSIKKGRKFDQVVEGARIVFLRDGYEGASVDDIAREAGVSKATLYSYFPDKRILFIEIAGLEMARQAEAGAQDIDFDASPEDVLRAIGHKLLSHMLSEFGRAIFRIAVAESERFPEIGRKFFESGPLVVRNKISSYLTLCVEREQLVIEDIDFASEQFMELCKVRAVEGRTFGCIDEVSDEIRDQVISSACAMFLKFYGVEK